MEVNQIISIQFPIVLILSFLSYIIYRTIGYKEFKLLTLGWIINLIYLVFNYFFSLPTTEGKILITVSNLASTFFFFLALQNNSSEIYVPGILKKLKIYQIASLLIIIGLVKLLPALPKNNITQYIVLRNIPTALLDFLVFLGLSVFFLKLSKKYQLLPLAFVGFLIYALIQFFSIIRNNSSDSAAVINMEKVGFALGLGSKVLIALGLIRLLPTSKDLFNKQAIATKLDDILGKTFHEIRYPLKSMSADLNKLIPPDEEKTISNRDEIYKIVKSVDSSFNHLAAIVGASYKLYETDIGKPLDNEDELFEIPEYTLETVSINTIIQIAILKIKAITNEKVEFHCEYASNCFVNCHSYQLLQVFQNLFYNAYEAFEGNKGKISIKTRVKTNAYNLEFGPKAIEIIIEDNGPGIPKIIQESIFEKGFTTKGSKGKRGFGLSIVKEIIESSSGKIFVYEEGSTSLGGAGFVIVFPQAKIFPKRA